MIKIISMYLPQFHRVKENDEWWGEGFTEWTAAKQAHPLFENHYQPHIPLNQNYYDLLDKKTMQWQADLMKKYGIDGQCIYHYWFKNGRQILERPAENLLHWTDIDMPFFFCWANESWARTWSHLRNRTPWSTELEPKQKAGDNGVLLEQQYGEEKEWKQHFEYLLPYFKDQRYIKINNKPVFMLYKTAEIYCLQEMMSFWRSWAKEEGFSGIYLIAANNLGSNIQDLTLLFEPEHTLRILKGGKKDSSGVCRYNYTEVWDEILNRSVKGEKISIQGFTGRDDTPRRGRGGQVVEHAEPEKFRKYLSELIAKNLSNGCELTFINAWNEWGEGMHLEPDEKNGYGFLEGIAYAKEHYQAYMDKYSRGALEPNAKEIEHLKGLNKRYQSYWMLLSDWLTLKETEVKLETYFLKKGYHSVAIYGIGLLGKHLYYELENSEIEIKCIIDRGATFSKNGVIICRPDEEFPKADVIVVTATYAYSVILEQLKERGYTNIVSLEQIIENLLETLV